MYIRFGLITFILGMLPVCFFQPWIGVLMWCWLGYMNPHKLSWGTTYGMPFAMMVAVATLAGLLFTKDLKPIPWVRETYLLAALWFFFLVTTVLSMYPAFAWDYLTRVSKILLFTFIPLLLFQDKRRFRYLILTVVMSIGFFGLKGGIWVILTGGANRVMMPEDSMIGEANGAGLAFNIIIPFLLYLGQEEKNFWMRRLLKVTFAFSIVSSLFTYSRGAVVGLVAIVLVLAAKSKHFVRAAVGIAILYVFMINFAPPEWFARMDTIQSYEEDASARSRIEAWKIAYRLALDHPFFGGGFGSVGMDEVAQKYNPGKGGYNSHSIYFNMMGEHGFLGLGLFLTLIGSSFVTLRQIRRQQPSVSSWIVAYSHALETALVAYLVTGAFLSVAYIDLSYHLITFVILLKFFADREAVEAAAVSRPTTALPRAREMAHVRNRRPR